MASPRLSVAAEAVSRGAISGIWAHLARNLGGLNGTRPLALPARLLAVAIVVAQAFLLGGLLLALIAPLRLDASAPFAGLTRAVLAALLRVGWGGVHAT